MPRLSFDAAAADAIAKAESDPQGATDALLILAHYLRAGQPVPHNLAAWVADAIEASMGKPHEVRGGALLRELNLTAHGRRPAASWVDVGMFVAAREGSKIEAIHDAAARWGIDETTVKRYVRRYEAANRD